MVSFRPLNNTKNNNNDNNNNNNNNNDSNNNNNNNNNNNDNSSHDYEVLPLSRHLTLFRASSFLSSNLTSTFEEALFSFTTYTLQKRSSLWLMG